MRILIGTPVYDWKTDARYTNSLAKTARLCAEKGIVLRELFQPGEAILPHARNMIWKAAVERDYDHLFMIDADQDWEPEWIVRLSEYPVDCVAAPVRKKSETEVWNIRAPEGAESFVADPRTGLWTAPGMTAGTGFIRFSKRALRALWDASEPYLGHGGREEFRWVFDARPVALDKPVKELVSEDTFCSFRLAEHGIPVWVDPHICSGHNDGQRRYVGDFARFVLRLRAEKAKAA